MSSSGHMPDRLFADPQKALIHDAVTTRRFEDLPEKIGRNHEKYLGVFGAPGIRALVYVIVDEQPCEVVGEFRDLISFTNPDGDGHVQITPFSQPAYAEYRPNGHSDGGLVKLALHEKEPDSDEYLAVSEDQDTPHIAVGWYEVPEPNSGDTDAE